MSLLLLPSNQERSPQRFSGLDRSNPLTLGLLVGFLPGMSPHGGYDPAKGRNYAGVVGNTRIIHHSSGGFVLYPNTAPGAPEVVIPGGFTTAAVTLFAQIYGTTTTTNQRVTHMTGTGSNPVINIHYGDGTNAWFNAQYRNPTPAQVNFGASAETAMVNGKLQTVIARFKSGLQTLYVDGVKSSVEGTDATTLWAAPSIKLLPGGGIGGVKTGLVLGYNRYIGDDECLELYRNAWQIFEQDAAERIYILPAAVGGTFNAAWAQGANAIIQPGALQ